MTAVTAFEREKLGFFNYFVLTVGNENFKRDRIHILKSVFKKRCSPFIV